MAETLAWMLPLVVIVTVMICALISSRDLSAIARLLQEQDRTTYYRLDLPDESGVAWSAGAQRYIFLREYRTSAIAQVRERGQRAWLCMVVALGAILLMGLLRIGAMLWGTL